MGGRMRTERTVLTISRVFSPWRDVGPTLYLPLSLFSGGKVTGACEAVEEES